MLITLQPGEMLSNIRSTRQSHNIVILFRSDWDYGDVVVVNDTDFITGYKRGDKKEFPGNSFVNLANGGLYPMYIEIITMQ